ncbi:MAG: hypothetical protein K0R09_2484 [Clostridiales bacterium]|jgi:hypothetical protein|nr:hypothetical protein [Clostridiales bacterium]
MIINKIIRRKIIYSVEYDNISKIKYRGGDTDEKDFEFFNGWITNSIYV